MSDKRWHDLLRNAASGQAVDLDGIPLPAMPDPAIQLRTVGQSGPGAMDEAWAFASQCLKRFQTSALFAGKRKVLLDFGTGWGRIARCFLRDFLAEDMIGAEIDGDLISICRTTFSGPRFLPCGPMPPLDLPDASVDFVTGYSVFSHLSEAACRAWTDEFARVLKPGGMAALTTRGRWFFDYAASLPPNDPYSRALSSMFSDFGDAKARYDRGEFVHSNAPGVTGGGVLDGGFYGETFISERFAREVLGNGSVSLFEFDAAADHPILFFEKAALRR